MHPILNHSLSSVESRLIFLADIDLLEKQESLDFPYVGDDELFKSFDVPVSFSIEDISTGTLLYKLASDSSVRPSARWWDFAVSTIAKAGESDAAPCAAEIYLARVAQMHIDAGEAQLEYIEGKSPGEWFIDSASGEGSSIEKQEETHSPPPPPTTAPPTPSPAPPVDGSKLFTPVVSGDMGTVTEAPQPDSISIGGQISDAAGTAMPTIQVPTNVDPASISEPEYKGEDTEFDDNIVGQSMGGLGLSDDEFKAEDVEGVKQVLDKINGYSSTLLEMVDSEDTLDFWILDKISRMGSDISDIKHHLEYNQKGEEVEKGLNHEHK